MDKTYKIFKQIKELANKRHWFNGLIWGEIAYSESSNYIRIRRENLNYGLEKTSHEVLVLIVDRIYEFIPEAKNSKIKLYLTNNTSTDILELNLAGQTYTIL